MQGTGIRMPRFAASLLLPRCEAGSKTHSLWVQDPPLPSRGGRRVLPPGFGVCGRGKVLTFNRPNSQARSRGVFFALLMRQGLDWCCSSISDCGGATWLWGAQHHPVPLPSPARCIITDQERDPVGVAPPLTYHLVVAVLRREVQRDLPVQRGHVDRGSSSQQHPHRLHAPLPGRVVQGAHPCGQRGLSRAGQGSGPRDRSEG